jgi:hypothetical protein
VSIQAEASSGVKRDMTNDKTQKERSGRRKKGKESVEARRGGGCIEIG